MPDSRHSRLAIALALLTLLTAGPALAQRDDTQFWLTQSAATKLGEANIITLELSERTREARIGPDQVQARVSFDRRVAPGVDVGGAFTWQRSGTANEYRIHQQIIFTRGLLALRSRLEQRFVDGADRTGWRLRERLQAALPLDRHERWAAIIAGEAFFHLNRTSTARRTGLAVMRSQIGLQHRLTSKAVLTLVYQRQQMVVAGGADTVNHEPALTIALQF